jgi:tRNA(Ile)-lysidine synthase
VLSRVQATIREHDLLTVGERVLVAVSGGPDSTALLVALTKLAPRLGISLAAATVDHGLRAAAAAEAEAVRRRCQQLGVPCELLKVDVGRARRRHMSVQEAAREARLAVLDRTAAHLGCTKIALGHHADDQAETVLFRVLRGTGLAGLAGIPYRRGAFIRPLLDVRRAQILSFLAKRKLDYSVDPSNLDRHYARARLRQDVLPVLERENPRVVEALVALARAARERGARSWQQQLPAGTYLPRRTREVVDRLVRSGAGSHRVAIGGGYLRIEYGNVAWQPEPPPSPDASTLLPRTIPAPGQVMVGRGNVLELTPLSDGAWPGGNVPCFDAEKVRWPLELRVPRPGDRMTPRAGRGSRKLSDLFIDAKIPRDERSTRPVLCDATGTILFVAGLRPSEVARPAAGTRVWFEVRLTR